LILPRHYDIDAIDAISHYLLIIDADYYWCHCHYAIAIITPLPYYIIITPYCHYWLTLLRHYSLLRHISAIDTPLLLPLLTLDWLLILFRYWLLLLFHYIIDITLRHYYAIIAIIIIIDIIDWWHYYYIDISDDIIIIIILLPLHYYAIIDYWLILPLPLLPLYDISFSLLRHYLLLLRHWY